MNTHCYRCTDKDFSVWQAMTTAPLLISGLAIALFYEIMHFIFIVFAIFRMWWHRIEFSRTSRNYADCCSLKRPKRVSDSAIGVGHFVIDDNHQD